MAIRDFFNVPVCAELVAFVAALFIFFDKGASYWRLFIAYLFLTLVVEYIGFNMKVKGVPTNSFIYNCFMIIQIAFFSFLSYKFHTSRQSRLYILIATGLITCFFIGEAIAKARDAPLLFIYQNHSRLALGIYVVLLCCSYFFHMIKSDTITNPARLSPFWICTGLFFFYFGSIVVFAFRDKVKEMRLTGNVGLYEIIMGTLCVVLYGSWVIGFLWKRKEIRSSRP